MEEENRKYIIAIDGYSSCGKSTLAKALAKVLNILFIDSGAMYRAVTLFALRNDFIDEKGVLNESKLELSLQDLKVTFDVSVSPQNPLILLNGEDVSGLIRSAAINDNVSKIASNSKVRHKLVEEQRLLGEKISLVMDGRDIGTVVFPHAEIKLFLTASPEVRTKRRFEEIRSGGDDSITIEQVRENLKKRDLMDTTRADSPLVKAADAIEIDNSDLTLEKEVEMVLAIVDNL